MPGKVMRILTSVLLTTLSISGFANTADCGISIVSPVGSGDTTYVCTGTSVALLVEGGTDHNWFPADDFDDPTIVNPTLTPSMSQWYYVTATVADSSCTDSIYVEVFDPIFDFTLATTDSVCQHEGLIVSFEANAPFEVSFLPTAGVTELGDGDYLFTPQTTTTYSFVATVGNCEFEDGFEVPVIPFVFEVMPDDTIFLCLPDSQRIDLNLFPADMDISWSPLDTTITLLDGGSSALVKPTISSTYMVIGETAKCVDTAIIYVRVDSLPNLDLNLVVEKPFYCAGEIITIYSQYADPLKYPDINFEWTPMDGQIQDSTNTENVAIILRDTTIFKRLTMNNACIDSMEIKIDVVPTNLPISITDTTLCEQDTFQVFILDEDIMDIEWEPAAGLSCTDCLNPTVTVIGAIVYTVSATKTSMECPVGASLTVNIKPDFQIPIDPNPAFTCPGEPVSFTIDDAGLTDLSVGVMPTGNVSCDDCTNPVVTTNAPTTLVVTAEIDDEAFCGARGVALVNIRDDERIVLDPVQTCPGDPVEIDLTGMGFENNPFVYLEPGNAGNISCNDCLTPTVTLVNPAVLIVETESQDPNFCLRIGNVNISFFNPDLQQEDTIFVCSGLEEDLDLTFLNLVNPELQIQPQPEFISCDDCLTPTIIINEPSTLTIVSESQEPDICFLHSIIPLALLPDETVSLNPVEVCAGTGEVLDLANLGFNEPITISGPAGSLSCTNCLMPTVTVSENTVLEIEGASDDPDFCKQSGSLQLIIAAPTTSSLSFMPPDPGQGDFVTINLMLDPPLPDGIIYTWNVNGTELQTSDPVLEVQLNEPLNSVSVSWTNLSGCLESASIMIMADPPSIDIPNAFTPNGDGLNETFRPVIKGNIQITEFVVFNRWGQKVYEGNNPTVGWDGMQDGELAPSDVYVYIIGYRAPNGNNEKLKGDVTLLR